MDSQSGKLERRMQLPSFIRAVLIVSAKYRPSWQWHTTENWIPLPRSPVRTLPVAPLWCDRSSCSRTVVVVEAAARLLLTISNKAFLCPGSSPARASPGTNELAVISAVTPVTVRLHRHDASHGAVLRSIRTVRASSESDSAGTSRAADSQVTVTVAFAPARRGRRVWHSASGSGARRQAAGGPAAGQRPVLAARGQGRSRHGGCDRNYRYRGLVTVT